MKYFGRFTLPLILKNKFIVILDDDVVPEKKWVEYAVRLCRDNNVFVSGYGAFIERNPNQWGKKYIEKPHSVSRENILAYKKNRNKP